MAIQKRKLKKPDDVKFYYRKLRNEIDDFLFSFKKRYQKFPVKEVSSILRHHFNKEDTLNISDVKYTAVEAEVEFRKTYRKLKARINTSYFNFILKAYQSDVKKNPDNARKAYDIYHSELQEGFKQMWTDLRFCLNVLRELGRIIEKETKITKESSTDDIMLEGSHTTNVFRKLYHVSDQNLDGKVLHPRIPHNKLTENDLEENKTARISFAPSIDRCLMALSQNLKGKELYVHIPIDKTEYQDVSKHQVADAKLTKEKWVTCDVTLKCIGKIKVNSAKDKPYHFTFNDVNPDKVKEKEMNPIETTYKWNWDWVNKYTKESEDILMNEIITLESINDDITYGELYEYMLESWDDDEFEDLIEEGVTTDTLKAAKDATKAVKETTKRIRKALKSEDFKEAKKLFEELDKKLDDVEKTIKNIEPGDNIDYIISAIAVMVEMLLKYVILMIPATSFGLAAKKAVKLGKLKAAMTLTKGTLVTAYTGTFIYGITEAINAFHQIIDVINKIKNRKELTADDFNPLKVRTIKYVKDLKAIVKRYKAHVEKIEKKRDPKAVKEAVEYDNTRIAIYEMCQNGDITVEDREELLTALHNKKIVSETVDELAENLVEVSNRELFEGVRLSLYNMCNNGEITEDQREDMLLEAFNQIFVTESDDEAGLDMKKVEKDIQNDKNLKDMEKQIKDAEKDNNNAE